MFVMYKSRSSTKFQDIHSLLVLLSSALTCCVPALVSGLQTDSFVRPFVNRLLVVTVATDPNHEGFQRFNRSIQTYNLELSVLSPTTNDEQVRRLAPERTLDLYRKALAVHKNEQDLLVMLVESQNLVLNGDRKSILQRFERFPAKTRIVFAADSTCWPDATLELKYPPLSSDGGDRFLNSAAFLGYAPALWDLLNLSNELDGPQTSGDQQGDDQLYYTGAYLKENIREKLAIELDHKAELFQSLRSPAESNVVALELNTTDLDGGGAKLKNVAYHTEPLVVLANSQASKVVLNSLGNYLAKSWTLRDGCRYCNESIIHLGSTSDSKLPSVLVGLFIEEATPFLDGFFSNVVRLNYPKTRIHLYLHSAIEYHEKQVADFVSTLGGSYASLQVLKAYGDQHPAGAAVNESQARSLALEHCQQVHCDFYLALDSVARLENVNTLRLLIESNRNIVAPLLSRPGKLWSNFWGSLTDDGYYARSSDYVELVKRERQGTWNVAHIMNAYLMRGKFIRENLDLQKFTYHDPSVDLKPVLIFSHRLRARDVFMYMTNTHDFGHLVDASGYNISRRYPDLYELENNMHDWDRLYIHENYSRVLDEDAKLEKPCQDVAWFPLVSDLFCEQMIDLMENFGQWSGGTNYDPRIEGGYESVPTRDIHLKQVDLHEMWLTFIREYVMPVQLKEFIGYEHEPPHAELAFVVRYHPAEQPSLQPHHDASTYTLNIALNRPHLDYEGGGCRFIRYNCSVTESRRGWGLIHPGRLTHYHEGLAVTKGTRYILVTFVDP